MLARFDRRTDPTEIAAALDRDGAAVVEGFLSPASTDRLVGDFAPHLEAVDWCNTTTGKPDEFHGLRTKRLHGLLARSEAFGEVVGDPLLRALCDRILRPLCHDYRLSTGELMALGGGQGRQTLHRDADSWLHFPSPRPEILFSANVALTDFTADNGATVVAPGSHRWPTDRKPAEDELVSAAMPRGSALLYVGNVLHGGGANATDEVRIGLYVGYILSWLRPIESHLATNGLDVVRNAPAAVQRLLDYTEDGFTVLA